MPGAPVAASAADRVWFGLEKLMKARAATRRSSGWPFAASRWCAVYRNISPTEVWKRPLPEEFVPTMATMMPAVVTAIQVPGAGQDLQVVVGCGRGEPSAVSRLP